LTFNGISFRVFFRKLKFIFSRFKDTERKREKEKGEERRREREREKEKG